MAVTPAAKAEADKAEKALGLLAAKDDDLIAQTTMPVELVSHNHQTATWSSPAQKQADGDIGTCVATTATIAAATANPAEIARLVAGLASPDGRVTLHAMPGDAQAPELTRTENDANRPEAFARIRQAVTAGHMVPIGVSYKEKQDDGTWHEGGHPMMIQTIDAKGIHVIDPIEGAHHVWSEEKVMHAVTDANLPAD